MSHSKFYSSLLLLIVLNAVIKPLWIFGIDRQVQNITGVIEYGTYFSLLNLSIVFSFLLDWGLTAFINRELAAKKISLQNQLGSFLVMKFVFALFYALVVTAIVFFTGVKRWDIVWAVIAVQFFTFLFVFLRSVVTANQWFVTDAWLSVLDKTLMIIVCSLFIFNSKIFGQITIEKFLLTQMACTIFAISITLIILLSRGIQFKKPDLKFFDKKLFLSVLPFALTVFLMSAHFRFDGFLLERLHPDGAHEAGIYAAAYRLLDASNMAGYLIASFLMPFVSRLWSEKKSLQEVILQSRHLLLMFSILIVSIATMMAPWLQKILYHRDDAYASNVLSLCLSALIGYSLVQIYGTVMTGTGNIIAFCRFNFFAVILNVVLNLFLIPRFGALGCSISALISQLMLGMATMLFVHHKIHKGIDVRSIIAYILTGFVLCGTIYFAMQTSVNNWVLLLLLGIETLLIMLAFRMIFVNSWPDFLKKI
jgi:O-antigen/teichoic acid export membrane protein